MSDRGGKYVRLLSTARSLDGISVTVIFLVGWGVSALFLSWGFNWLAQETVIILGLTIIYVVKWRPKILNWLEDTKHD